MAYIPARPLPEVEVKLVSHPSPVNPVLVCGLPGSGYVGKLAADYLVTVFKARKVAEFDSTLFPPHVNVDEEGRARKLRGEMFHAETGQRKDLLIFTADAQPTSSDGEYELAGAVLDHARSLSAAHVYSLAAYVTGNFVRARRVFGTATSSELVELLAKRGVQVMREGGISGMNGITVGMARLFGMEGASLLGETSGYLLDPAASYAVLEALSKMLEIEIDLTSIEERAKEAQQIFSQVQRMGEPNAEEARGAKEEGRPGYIA